MKSFAPGSDSENSAELLPYSDKGMEFCFALYVEYLNSHVFLMSMEEALGIVLLASRLLSRRGCGGAGAAVEQLDDFFFFLVFLGLQQQPHGDTRKRDLFLR